MTEKRKLFRNLVETMWGKESVLNEVLSNPYEYQFVGGHIPMWKFRDGAGEVYNVILTPIDMETVSMGSANQENVLFILGYARESTHSSTEMTGNREVFHILSTVVNIVKDFVNKRYKHFPDFDAAIFFGGVPDFSGGETADTLTKRSRVYGKFIKRIIENEPDFEFHDDGNARRRR